MEYPYLIIGNIFQFLSEYSYDNQLNIRHRLFHNF